MQRKDMDKIIEKYNKDKCSILAILQDLQAKEKYLPKESLEYIGEQLNIPINKIYRIATFYRAFSLVPRGRHEINVCLGTACHVRGAQRIVDQFSFELGIKPGQTTKDGNFSLGTVNCLGVCASGPVVAVDDQYYSKMSSVKVKEVIAKVLGKREGKDEKK
jgi:NADH-quinone oxidoreductase subunit E